MRKTFLAAFIGLASLFTLPAFTLPAMAEETSPDRATVESWVRDYLVKNPEVIVEAMAVLQQRQQAEQAAQIKQFAAQMGKLAARDPLIPSFGPDDAPVTVFEFFDYHCGHCKNVLQDVLELTKTRSDVRVVFLEYPLLIQESYVAALAATASLKQNPDKYLDFHNAMMSAKGKLNEGRIIEIAQDVGLDPARLAKDMRSEEVGNAVNRNLMLGNEVGINGTPNFIVGGKSYAGERNLKELNRLIDEALKNQDG